MEAMEIMGMDQQGLEELAAQLAKELLARKGYDVIDGDWMLGRRGLVARDGDCLVFADVAPDLGVDCGFEPIDIDRSAAEGAAFAYLSGSYGGRRRRDSVRRRQGQAPPRRQGIRQARRERPRRGRLARLGGPYGLDCRRHSSASIGYASAIASSTALRYRAYSSPMPIWPFPS